MDIEEYHRAIAEIASELDLMSMGPWEAMDQLINRKAGPVWNAVEWRKTQLVPSDRERANGYLILGFARNFDEETRLAFFTVAFEVGKDMRARNRRRICERYKREHPIFVQKPALWEEVRKTASGASDHELLSTKRLRQYLDTELFEFDGLNFELSRYIQPSVVSWARKVYPKSPIYVRLNPYVFKHDRVVRLDCEMIVPPNPRWWENVNLHRGEMDGGSFCLQDCPCTPETKARFWEYQVEGLRKLQVSAIRRYSDNLSMMVEELAIDGDGVLGRMIHLDSDSPAGTPVDRCSLNHLDLAINFYEGDTAKTRLNEDLSNGAKIVDATHRIHLFRVEGAPLTSLFVFADQFFKSEIMKEEWRASQLEAGKKT